MDGKLIHTDIKIRSIALSLLSYLKSPDISDKQHSWANCFTDLEKKEFIQELQMAIENVPLGEDWSEVQEVSVPSVHLSSLQMGYRKINGLRLFLVDNWNPA